MLVSNGELTIFQKLVQGNAVFLIEMTKGKDKLVMVATARDPVGRYKYLLNNDILYPLDNDAFAAEYGEVYLPDKDNSYGITYDYYSKPKLLIESALNIERFEPLCSAKGGLLWALILITKRMLIKN